MCVIGYGCPFLIVATDLIASYIADLSKDTDGKVLYYIISLYILMLYIGWLYQNFQKVGHCK